MTEQTRTWVLGLVAAGLALLALGLLLVAPQLARAANRDVCGTCTYQTIQEAIDAADPGDTIRVVAGTFTEGLEISKSLTLEGGYAAGFGSRTPRDTTLQGSSRVMTITGSAIQVTVDGFEITGGDTTAASGSDADGAGIYANVDTGSKVVIHDNYIHDNDAGDDGGGIYADMEDRSDLEITNNAIMSNTTVSGSGHDGAGIYADVYVSGTLTLANNQIERNESGGRRGGFYAAVEYYGRFSVTDNVVMSNTATTASYDDGGFYFEVDYHSHGSFDGNQVIGNEAGASHGGGYVYLDHNSSSTFYDNEFWGNTAGSSYGGLYLEVYYNSHVVGDGLVLADNEAGYEGGGEIYAEYNSTVTLPNTQVTGNRATSGSCGGLYLDPDDNATLTLPHLYVYDNAALGGDGGGLYLSLDLSSDRVIAPNAQVISNTASGWGGGIYIYDDDEYESGTLADLTGSDFFTNTAGNNGGGLYAYQLKGSATLLLNGTAWVSNTADSGGALYVDYVAYDSRVEIDASSSGKRFERNTARSGDGGAIYWYDSEYGSYFSLTGYDFINNTATGYGGAFYCYEDLAYEGSEAHLDGNYFHHNEAESYGGAVYIDILAYEGGTATVNNNRVISNTAGDAGGGLYLGYVDYGSYAEVISNTVEDNFTDSGEGGGVYIDYLDEGSTVHFRDNLVSANVISSTSGWDGGGVYIDYLDAGSRLEFTGNEITDNVATGLGGGVYLDYVDDGSHALFDDNIITGNEAGDDGGGFYLDYMDYGSVVEFTNNQVNDNETASYGGGFLLGNYMDDASRLIMRGNEFLRNTAEDGTGGCGIWYVSDGSQVYFEDNLCNDNLSYASEGGCQFYDFDDYATLLVVRDNQFNGNKAATDNGGVSFSDHAYGARIDFVGNQVIGNQAGITDTTPTATGGQVGGVYLELEDGSLAIFDDNEIRDNTAHAGTGPQAGSYGGLYAYLNEGSLFKMLDNQITGNEAKDSVGGLEVDLNVTSRLEMDRNAITANTAMTDTGGLYIYGEDDDNQYFLRRNYIVDNVANAAFAGGLRVEDNDGDDLWGYSENNLIAGNTGDGVSLVNADWRGPNDTIAGNSGHAFAFTGTVTSTINLLNDIVWGNTGGLLQDTGVAPASIVAEYSDVQGGVLPPPGNKSEDPLFVGGGNYRLQLSSPAVDEADTARAPATDLDGIPRPVPAGGEADMGCYEWFLAGVTLEPDGTGSAKPGNIVTYDLTVTNDGNIPDTFDLTIPIKSLPWPATLSVDSVTLDPGASTTIQVSVTVPAGTDAGTVADMTVQATSRANPVVLDIATLATTAELDPGVSLEPDRTAGGTGGSVVVYEHTLTNLSNGTETFLFSASSSQGWTVVLSAAAATLAKGDSTTIKVYVSIPADAPLGTVDVTTVTATASTDNTVSDSVTDTTTREAAPFNVLLPTIMRNH